MLIHLLHPVVLTTALNTAIKEAIDSTGHEVTERKEDADLLIGTPESGWPNGDSKQQLVVFKNPHIVDSVPGDAIIFNIFTMKTLYAEPSVSFSEFLEG